MNASSILVEYKLKSFNADDKATFRQTLLELKEPYRLNKLHLHEQLFLDYNPGAHTLEDCVQANNSNLDLSRPRLFQGTFIENDKLWIAWGFVAFEWSH